MDKLKPKEKLFWQQYLETLPKGKRPRAPDVSVDFCGNREITDELLVLYLLGKKTTGSGIVKDYESAGDPLPRVGGYWIILDSRDNSRCIVRTVRVVTNRFKDIPEEIAIAEGEGDLSVA